jgi:tetratricopeptide (TPR) repeat protein
MLGKLYHKLPSMSVLKGICCFLLAQLARFDSNDTKAAEKRLFESVYIFDQSPGIVDSVPTIVSDYGIRALVEFGDILVANGKYPLASFAYKAAADCFKLCHGDYNYELISNLVKLSRDQGDWKRTVEYLHILLNKAQLEGDTTKVAHLSERLSEEYMDKGDFKNAEEYLCKSINFVKGVASGANVATTTAPG